MLLTLMLLISPVMAEDESEQPPSGEATQQPTPSPSPAPTPTPITEPAEPTPTPTTEPTPEPETETPGGADSTTQPEASATSPEDLTPEPTQDLSASPAPSDSPGVDTTLEPGGSPDASTSPGSDDSMEPDVTPDAGTQTPSSGETLGNPSEETPLPKGLELLPRLQGSTFRGITPSGDEGLKVPILYQTDYPDIVCTVDNIERSVATSGCGATCASMVIAYLTGDTEQTPYTLFYDAVKAGHYKGNGLGHDVLSWLLNSHGVKCSWVSKSESAIRDALETGKPVIAHMGSGIFTEGGHYIVLRGITEDGKLLVNDPNSSANTNMTFSFDVILSQTRSSTPLLICGAGSSASSEKKAQPDVTPEPSPDIIGEIGRLPLPKPTPTPTPVPFPGV